MGQIFVVTSVVRTSNRLLGRGRGRGVPSILIRDGGREAEVLITQLVNHRSANEDYGLFSR